MTVIPQIQATRTNNHSGPSTANPIKIEHVPDIVKMITVVLLRPYLSAMIPAITELGAPIPITKNANAEGFNTNEPAGSTKMTKARNQPHIAYSSHMCPKYPAFANIMRLLRRLVPICRGSIVVLANLCGPSFRAKKKRSLKNRHATELSLMTSVQSKPVSIAPTRCGNANPSVNAPTTAHIAKSRTIWVRLATNFISGGYKPARASPARNRDATRPPEVWL